MYVSLPKMKRSRAVLRDSKEVFEDDAADPCSSKFYNSPINILSEIKRLNATRNWPCFDDLSTARGSKLF